MGILTHPTEATAALASVARHAASDADGLPQHARGAKRSCLAAELGRILTAARGRFQAAGSRPADSHPADPSGRRYRSDFFALPPVD